MPEPAAPPDGTLGPNDYKFIYDLLTSSDASQRQQGQQFASKLRPDEAQKFFEFQHAVNQPDPNASPDRDMVKAFGIGISPEMALGAGQAGRAIVGAVRGTGAVAGAVEAAAQLAPTVKYELAKTALTSMGVPTPLAVLAAQAISLYRGGGPTTKAATTTSEAGTANTINSRASGTGMTPGEAPPVTATPTGFTMVRPTPNAAPPSAPPTGPVAAPAPAPAAPVRQTPPPVEPPPAASAPVQSAPPPAPAPQASPAPTALSGAAAQGALVQAAARAKVSLTKAELDAMVPHVVAGHPPDQVVEALVALRQAPAAAAPVAEPVAPRPAQVEVEGNIPASKSRRGVPSATPGLTVADVEDLGLNPALKIKKLTPDMMARVMRNRAQRAALYRSDAAFAKSTNAMSQRD